MLIERAMHQFRMPLAGAVLIAVAGIGAGEAAKIRGRNLILASPPLPIKTAVCGPNVLYMLLKLQGCPVTFQQVVQELGSDDKMTSLLEFAEAAARLGRRPGSAVVLWRN